jgi:hypothetical protein
MKALCIDPGTTHSGVVIYDGKKIYNIFKNIKNEDVLEYWCSPMRRCMSPEDNVDIMIIEGIASYGMAVGKETFETCEWIGRFRQEFGFSKTHKVYRKDVKMYLCNSMRAKDANIRQAIIDKFPRSGGGKIPQIGTKKKPGPLYGVSSHAWSALALGITYFKK